VSAAAAGGPDAAPAPGPRAGERWLVVAPHPDDETLAAGGLLQRARSAGASVRVVLLTDGGSNPWPQRYVERRIGLDAAARRRWAARRRAECRAALATLGVDADAELVAFGWPDGDVTERLFDPAAGAVEELRGALEAFAPTHVVVPAADDRHPDHNVAPVLLALALRGTARPPRVYAYRIHGGSRGDGLTLALSAAELDRKRTALECHATQLALSGRRFRGLVRPVEAFDADPFGPAADRSPGLPGWLEALLRPLQRDWRWRLAGWAADGRLVLGTRPAQGPYASLKGGEADPDVIFTKLEPGRRGPWIYDVHGWGRSPGRAA
jgi:LmbE family N-acetylglucosaminyl deacetylase